jgi:hypothetical protein
MLVSALGEGLAAYLERHADAEAGCWWSGRDRAGAGHHLWCGHPGSSAPRVNERRINEQEARVPVWEEEYRQFCKRSLEGDNVYVWCGWSALQRTAFG